MAARQEVLNVLLAQLLAERGLIAAPEQILNAAESGSRGNVSLPDVLVDLNGLRMILEAEFAGPANAAQKAYAKAKERVEQGIAHIGVGIVYPAALRGTAFHRQKEALAAARLQFTIVTEATDIPAQQSLFPDFSAPTFERGVLNDLAESLRRCYERMVRDETLDMAVSKMEEAIAVFLGALRVQPATTERIAMGLGMRETRQGKPLSQMKPRERQAVNRIAGLILVNAMIFQEVLSKTNGQVHALTRYTGAADPVGDVRGHWWFILDKINYHPIFRTAFDVLNALTADQDMRRALDGMIDTALWIVRWKASLRHDLAGRIFHRILAEAKHLGAYYTSIPSASLLLKLALPRDASFDWSDLEAIRKLVIADLACGTGTLLMAAADVVLDNHIRACAEKRIPPQLNNLHSIVVGNVIYGFDVLPSAIHLTASTLALRVPDEPINVTKLSCLRLGGEGAQLGSLEFFEGRIAEGTLYSRPETASGVSTEVAHVRLPDIDVCVMNPPFTSSRQPNLLFGNLPDPDRARLQKRLKRIVHDRDVPAQITAGLAAVFTALADQYIKPGGRIALVLPRAILTGAAWAKTRDRLARDYALLYVLASHAPGQWNFSENTKFSEVMLTARKRAEGEEADEGERVVFVNLWRQPQNAVEALSVARAMERDAPDLKTGQGALQITIRDQKYGEVVSVPWADLRTAPAWELPCAFAHVDLIRVLMDLREGRLRLPGQVKSVEIPLKPLGGFAELGPDPRDVADGYDVATGRTAYPALLGHDADVVNTMRQRPNRFLEPLAGARAGRPLRKHTDLWPRAGRVHIVQRIRMNTKRMLAVRLSQKSLADVWWPLRLQADVPDAQAAEKALVLWLNSTPALLLLLACREETEGAWVQFKKPTLRRLPVVDLRGAGREKIAAMAAAYDCLASSPIGLLPSLARDATRAAVDAAVAEALGLPDFSVLRELLAAEPILTQATADADTPEPDESEDAEEDE